MRVARGMRPMLVYCVRQLERKVIGVDVKTVVAELLRSRLDRHGIAKLGLGSGLGWCGDGLLHGSRCRSSLGSRHGATLGDSGNW